MLTASVNALKKMKYIVKKQNGEAILLYLQGGGCSGLKYKFEIKIESIS